MSLPRFTEAPIITVLREQETQIATAEVRRKHGVILPTFYK